MRWLALLLVLLMCGAASAATSDFGYYKIITINQTMVNQSIGDGQYPLLVSTTDTDLRDRCQADGDDIVFYDADNTTQLAHQIEGEFNSTTGELKAWVNASDISNVTHVVMYYYDADGTNLEDSSGVWGKNATGVWLFDEGSGSYLNDSSGMDNNGTIYGSPTWGDGLNFANDESDYVELQDMQQCTEGVSEFTIVVDTTWGSSTVDECVIDFSNLVSGGWYENSILIFRDDVGTSRNDVISFFIGVDGSITKVESIAGIATSGINHHIVGTLGNGNMRLYVNGIEDLNSPTSLASTCPSLDQLPWIGRVHSTAGSRRPHNGNIKHLRFYNCTLSDDEISTGYNNTAYPSLFISLGSEQSTGGDTTAPSVTSVADSPDPQGFGENVTISATITDAVGVHTAFTGVTPPGGSETNYSMSNTGSAYIYNFADWTNGSYSYTIYANDSADNWNNTETGTFNLYSETYIHIKTLKDTHGAGEYVNITDPASISSTSGSIIDDGNITVSGSDFGAIGPTLHKWDDFEGSTHTIGQTVGNGPGATAWTYKAASSSATEPKVDNNGCRTNSIKHIRCNFDYNTDGNKYRNSFRFDNQASFTPVYLTWWFRWNAPGSVASSNMKPFWPLAGDPSLPSAPRMSAMTANEGSYNWVIHADQTWKTIPTEGDWVRLEVYGVESTVSTSDGTVIIDMQYSNGATFTSIWNDTTQETRSSDQWESCVFGDYTALTTNVHQQNDFDDIYITNSRARIEMGNNSTWASCTHREIQIPINWSDTSANITINQGAFGDADTAYLFVVNSAGVVSDGYLITFGAGSAPVRSACAPTGAQTAGTTSLNISLTTDINATCKFENNTGGVAYDSMTYTFGSTGLLSHETTVTGLSDGNEYTYCVKCNSTAGNANTDDYNITFSISNVNNTMTTWDTSDGALKNASETIYFYVNYTNATGPINSSGDYVNISFADDVSGPFAGNISMTYNATTEWYDYNRSWATVGQYFYEVKAYEGSVLDQEEINYIDVDYQSRIYNKQTTNNITANVLMQVEFYNTTTSSWVLDDVCYNSSHQITQETNLKLDDLFNGTWHTTDNASFGGGTYRVYVAYTDPSGNVLENLDGTYMNDSYNFTLDTGVNTITLYANEYAVLNNWTADQTFSQIAANVSNDVAYSYYNSTSGLWEAYRAGYTYNANAIVPKNCSAFVFVNSQTTASATPNTGGVTITQDAWFYGYLPGSTAKTLTEIETAMDTDGLDVWSLYGWDNATQVYTTTGSYSVSPNEGYAAYVNTTGEYTP